MMTTTVVKTAAGLILAIDLGKYKCVACEFRPAARSTWWPDPPTDADQDLLAWS